MKLKWQPLVGFGQSTAIQLGNHSLPAAWKEVFFVIYILFRLTQGVK
jgi:hypothetical protein